MLKPIISNTIEAICYKISALKKNNSPLVQTKRLLFSIFSHYNLDILPTKFSINLLIGPFAIIAIMALN
jgi:hypothetical protein